jgi:hypothetical protein
MTVINGARLANFSVSPDGSMISINVIDENAERYHDPSLRLVYPLGKWNMETSTEPGKLILTLSTPDGFAVSFAVTPAELKQFASTAKRARRARVPPPN